MRDVSMLEEYVDCVRHGLEHHGDFVRFQDMSAQENGNMQPKEN